jgi:hypothetical protein
MMDVDKIARIQQLLSIRKNITSFFTERYEDLQSMKECHSISTDNILEFARYTTFTLKAPEGWVPGMPLIGGKHTFTTFLDFMNSRLIVMSCML